MTPDTLLRRLVARLDETSGLLLEATAGTQESARMASCLADNHRTLAEARALLRSRWSFGQFTTLYIIEALSRAKGAAE
jgi:hypothetical protein